MSGVPYRKRDVGLQWWLAGVVLLTAAWSARAQPGPTGGEAAATSPPATVQDSGIVQTGCPGCASGSLPPPQYNSHGGDDGCGCGCGSCKGCGCIPGQPKCYCECFGDCNNCFTRFIGGVYSCVCCPDPCYEPHWNALHDTAFFQDAARPVTQMKLTWDNAWNYQNPDRAERFWARERTTPNQLGPGGVCAPTGFGKGPTGIAKTLDYQQLAFTTEAATGAAGISITMPYLHESPTGGLAQATLGTNPVPANDPQRILAAQGPAGQAQVLNFQQSHGVSTGSMNCPESGFGDMIIGTKAMLLDCDCIQVTFGFKTYLPTGDFTKGLGVGHVSLEPSLIFGIPLCKGCFLQMQQAYWIPIAGDPLYQANIYHGHYAVNHELWSPCPGLKLVGTLELNHWVVFTGAFTDPEFTLVVPSANNGQRSPIAQPAGGSIVSVGPGIRFVICDKIDFGVGSAIAITGPRWEEELIRAEFRWRF